MTIHCIQFINHFSLIIQSTVSLYVLNLLQTLIKPSSHQHGWIHIIHIILPRNDIANLFHSHINRLQILLHSILQKATLWEECLAATQWVYIQRHCRRDWFLLFHPCHRFEFVASPRRICESYSLRFSFLKRKIPTFIGSQRPPFVFVAPLSNTGLYDVGRGHQRQSPTSISFSFSPWETNGPDRVGGTGQKSSRGRIARQRLGEGEESIAAGEVRRRGRRRTGRSSMTEEARRHAIVVVIPSVSIVITNRTIF